MGVERSALTPAESDWISAQLSIAAALARAYTGDSEEPPSLDRLDSTWLAWQRDQSPSKPDANSVVNGLGIAFGKHLAAALQLDWSIVTDEYGTDLAVFGEPGAVTFFPASMIAKRLHELDPIFTQLYRAAVGSVHQLKSKLS